MEQVETLVIGAGQAGLAASHHLTRLRREHLVVDAGDVGETWRSRRWDSFTLVTPNWAIRLPGMEPLADRGGFLPRGEVVDLLTGYAATNDVPLQTNAAVTSLDPAPAGSAGRFVATSEAGEIVARNVVVATGWFRVPRRPAWADSIDPSVVQIGAAEYRNPATLSDGGVLIVGSAQTGCQIAEELHLAGRDVWLATGKVGRVPRRYRGRDGFEWWELLGGFDLTEDQLPDPRGRFGPNPHISGTRGGHTVNLHRFARDGIRLLGHLAGADGTRLTIAPDLHENVGRGDFIAGQFRQDIDRLIEERAIDAPASDPTDPWNSDDHVGREAFELEQRESLDVAAAGIGTIIWATGYLPDHGWIHLPVFDPAGNPRHDGGVTTEPGLGFVGLRYQRRMQSDLLYGVGEDARFVVERLLGAESADPAPPAAASPAPGR